MQCADSDVEILQLSAQPVLVVRATIRVADLGEAVGERASALSEFLRREGIRPIGPPFVRYHTFGDAESDFELGVPVAAASLGEGRIAVGELPAGSAVATWHVGPHDRLGEAYGRLAAWLEAHGRAARGPAWEVYPWLDLASYGGHSTLPDPSTWRTQLVQPIE